MPESADNTQCSSLLIVLFLELHLLESTSTLLVKRERQKKTDKNDGNRLDYIQRSTAYTKRTTVATANSLASALYIYVYLLLVVCLSWARAHARSGVHSVLIYHAMLLGTDPPRCEKYTTPYSGELPTLPVCPSHIPVLFRAPALLGRGIL